MIGKAKMEMKVGLRDIHLSFSICINGISTVIIYSAKTHCTTITDIFTPPLFLSPKTIGFCLKSFCIFGTVRS